jgi:hypothetical protein
MRSLVRFRPGPQRAELNMLAVMLGDLVSPDPPHRLDAFGHNHPAFRRVSTVVLGSSGIHPAPTPNRTLPPDMGEVSAYFAALYLLHEFTRARSGRDVSVLR